MKSEGLNVWSSGALERYWRSSSVHSTGAWSPQAVCCSAEQQDLTVGCPPTRLRMTCWLERAESVEETSGISVAGMMNPVAGSVQDELRTRGRTSHPCRPRSEDVVVVMSSCVQRSFNIRQGSYRTQTKQVRHTIIASLSFSLWNTYSIQKNYTNRYLLPLYRYFFKSSFCGPFTIPQLKIWITVFYSSEMPGFKITLQHALNMLNTAY